MRTRLAGAVSLLALLAPGCEARAQGEPAVAEGHYRLELSPEWSPLPAAVLAQLVRPGEPPYDMGFYLSDARVPAVTALLVRHELVDIQPQTPHRWREDFHSARGLETLWDPQQHRVTYTEELPGALPLTRLTARFYGRDRVVTVTCTAPTDDYDALAPRFYEALAALRFDEGHGPGGYGRRLATAAVVLAALATIGFYFQRRAG